MPHLIRRVLKDRIRAAAPTLRKWLSRLQEEDAPGGVKTGEFDVILPRDKTIEILDKHGLAYDVNGREGWWLASFLQQRNSKDDLTRAVLRFIREHVDRDALIFASGCGCGWILLWLAQNGFQNLKGSDILEGAVGAARELGELTGTPLDVWKDNGFSPARIPKGIGVFIAIYWIYSAWDGNYSSENAGLKNKDHYALLDDFVGRYADSIFPGGYFIIELIDSMANLRPEESGIYSVRHSFEDVTRCMNAHGFEIIKRYLGWAHQPRMTYIARKR